MKTKKSEAITTIFEAESPRLFKYLLRKKSAFVSNILEVARIVEPVLNKISEVFPQYTMHEIRHSIRIMEYIYDLIVDINKLNELEVTLLIYSAMLHDIGMYVSPVEIKKIEKDIDILSDVKFSAMLKIKKDKGIALQEYVRRIHAKRSAYFIVNELADYLVIPGQPTICLAQDIALLCESHTQNFQWIRDNLKYYNEKNIYSYNPSYCACLLRLGDILDIDSGRTPPFLYKLISPEGISDDEWKQHLVIYNSNKVKTNDNGQKYIELFGECHDARIHRKLLIYLEWINKEIYNSNNIGNIFEDRHKIDIKYPLIDKIEAKGYSISNLKLHVDFLSITNLLMGEKIYGDSRYGLRELVQNSIDSCKTRQEEVNKGIGNTYNKNYSPTVQVILDVNSDQVIIKDNGTGMTRDIIDNFFLNVGSSYYRSEEFKLKNLNFKPIGNFGIGFLACFMLSEQVTVVTRHYRGQDKYKIELVKNSEYITLFKETDVGFEGTEIILSYKNFKNKFTSDVDVINFIKNNFLSEHVNLEVIETKKRSLNQVSNLLSTDIKCIKNEYEIDISKFFKNAEGFIRIVFRGNAVGKNFKDLPLYGNLQYFDGKKILDTSKAEFKDLILNDDINVIHATIVNSENESRVDELYEILEDYEDVYEKIDELDDYTFLLKNDVRYINRRGSFLLVDDEEDVIENFNLNLLEKLGHIKSYPSAINTRILNVFFDEKSKKFINYQKYAWFSGYLYGKDNVTKELYLRDVWIKDFKFHPVNLISSVFLSDVKINILDDSIIPNISRSDLDMQSSNILTNAISKCIYNWMLENNIFHKDDVGIYKRFIDKYFKNKNSLLR